VDHRGVAAVVLLVPQVLVARIGVDLSDIGRLEVCSWGSDFLLSSDSSGGVGVFTLLMLRVCFSILWWYTCRDDQDLAI
jgi:hypothetical protein